jgi:hypothetical protein
MTLQNKQRPQKPVGPAKGAVAGGVLMALGSVLVAQKLFPEVASSQSLTLLVVFAGLIVGGLLGFIISRKKNNP